MKIEHYYPPVPLLWAQGVTRLTPSEVAYGIQYGFLDAAPAEEGRAPGQPWFAALEGSELAGARDVLFRLLLIHLYKHLFSLKSPLRALEFLVLDFEDCPTARSGHGKLLSGVAGISDGNQTSELDPEYFEQKVKTFRFLSEYVIQIVREGIRNVSA